MVLITLVCCYFGLWEATKRQGVADVNEYLGGADTSAPVPLIVVLDFEGWAGYPMTKRYYYFWFFGYVAKLPFERELL